MYTKQNKSFFCNWPSFYLMKSRLRFFIGDVSVMAATTVGAGIFSLPYIFARAGWLTGIFYLVIMTAVIMFVHSLFWRALVVADGRGGLLSLGKFYLGKAGFGFGFVAIIGGLILTLVIYLILGSRFLNILWPALGEKPGFLIFWIIASFPLLLQERRFSVLETLGIILMVAIICLIFFSFWRSSAIFKIPAVNTGNLFLPFGAVLFALAGWTAVEPIYRARREEISSDSVSRPVAGLFAGTVVAAILYFMFIVGIFGSIAPITADTLSGLTAWPMWRLGMLVVFALFAIWTSYFPIGNEIKNSLERDVGARRFVSLSVVFLLPIILVNLGLSSFLKAVALAGGVFLSIQYLLIILVARKGLVFGKTGRTLLDLLILIFVAAAVYELYYFLK